MKRAMLLLTTASLLATSATALGGTPDDGDLATTIQAMKSRIKDQELRLTELEDRLSEERLQADRRKELLAILKEMNADAPKAGAGEGWLDGLTFFGDVRLRYQFTHFNGGVHEQNLARFRARVGVKKTWLDKQLEVGVRLASGSSDDPTSTNQTFDNVFSEKQVWIDLAYAKYQPQGVEGLVLTGGKMKNPFVHTNMIWDSDVNPEGFWAQYTCKKNEKFQPFAGVGFFQVEHNTDDPDATLMAYQGGFHSKLPRGVKWTLAVTYYDWEEYEDNYRRTGGNPASDGRLTGEEFDVLNLINKLSWKAGKLPMSLTFDLARNMSNRDGGSCAVAGIFKIGQNKKAGDFSIKYKYAYIGKNATPGGLTDSDFGYANRKGHQVGAVYSITSYLTAGVNAFYTEEIVGDADMFNVLVDLVWKF